MSQRCLIEILIYNLWLISKPEATVKGKNFLRWKRRKSWEEPNSKGNTSSSGWHRINNFYYQIVLIVLTETWVWASAYTIDGWSTTSTPCIKTQVKLKIKILARFKKCLWCAIQGKKHMAHEMLPFCWESNTVCYIRGTRNSSTHFL